MRFDGGKSLGRDEVTARRSGANCANHIGTNCCRNKSELYLRKTETCVFDRNHDIGSGNQAYSTAKGVSLNPRDDWFWACVNRLQHGSELIGIIEIGLVRQF